MQEGLFRVAITAVLFTFPATAQVTRIVDAKGGSQVFTDIQPAIDASSTGDAILVRAGAYSGFRLRTKAISLLAEPGARVATGTMQSAILSDLPAGSTTIVRGLEFDATFSSQIAIIGSAGTIVFDGVTMKGQMRLCDFTHANVVRIERCSFQGTIMFQSGTTGIATDSTFTGVTDAAAKFVQRPAIRLSASTGHSLYLCKCSVRGADAATAQDKPSAAIEATGQARLVVRGDASNSIIAGIGALPISAIQAIAPHGNELVIDPRIVVTGNAAVAIDWMGPIVRRTDPTLVASPAKLGTTMTIDVGYVARTLHFVMIGAIPANPIATPIGDIDIVNPILLLSGAGAVVRHSVMVPGVPALRGSVAQWQVLGWNPSTNALRLGNASTSILH